MPTYMMWNTEIIKHFLTTTPRGSHLVLSVNAETLNLIAQKFPEYIPDYNWVDDFCRSVAAHCIRQNAVEMRFFTNPSLRNSDNRPRYAAFLGILVLAAHEMGEEGFVSNTYFEHLGRMLGIITERAGLKLGEEEQLWRDWNRWLRTKGYIPSATSGDGAYKYTGYAISQALLRRSDQKKLVKHFQNNSVSRHLDEDTLMARLRQNRQYLTAHLNDLLDSRSAVGVQLYPHVSQACYDTYERWLIEGTTHGERRHTETALSHIVRAGIYRHEDPFLGDIVYQLFPRWRSGQDLSKATITQDGQTFTFQVEGANWYLPLWALTEDDLNEGLDIPISGEAHAEKLILSKRPYWILTPDPVVPESDIYATWFQGTSLGEPFVLLCRDDAEIHKDLKMLQNEGLLRWKSTVHPFGQDGGWIEYQGVEVVAEPYAWDGVRISHDDLLQALRPNAALSISLRGGLRLPGTNKWIVNHGPTLVAAAFHEDIGIEIFDIEADEFASEDAAEAGKEIELSWDRVGQFELTVSQGGMKVTRLVQITDWNNVEMLAGVAEVPAEIQATGVFGALILDQ